MKCFQQHPGNPPLPIHVVLTNHQFCKAIVNNVSTAGCSRQSVGKVLVRTVISTLNLAQSLVSREDWHGGGADIGEEVGWGETVAVSSLDLTMSEWLSSHALVIYILVIEGNGEMRRNVTGNVTKWEKVRTDLCVHQHWMGGTSRASSVSWPTCNIPTWRVANRSSCSWWPWGLHKRMKDQLEWFSLKWYMLPLPSWNGSV